MDPASKNTSPSTTPANKIRPWSFIPHAEFAYGYCRNFSSLFLTLCFKTLGASNTVVGLTSFLQAPIAFNALWAPAVDQFGTHRANLLRSLTLIAVFAAVLGVSMFFIGNALLVAAVIFFLITLSMSVLEIAYIGFKVSALKSRELELFAGIGNACWRCGLMFGSVVMVYLAGVINEQSGSYHVAWGCVFLTSSLMIFAFVLYLRWKMPFPIEDKGGRGRLSVKSYFDGFIEFYKQKRGPVIIAYLSLAVLGEGVLGAMKTPFFIDEPEVGGLGLDLKMIGTMSPFILGTMILSGVTGGLLLNKFGLRRCFFLFGFLMFIPNVCISWLAANPKYTVWSHTVDFLWMFPVDLVINPWVLGAAIIEMAGYGLAFSAYLAFGALVVKMSVNNKATFGAIFTSLNLIGFMIGGGISGIIQESVGYFWTFNISILLSLPAWMLILFLPIQHISDTTRAMDEEELARADS